MHRYYFLLFALCFCCPGLWAQDKIPEAPILKHPSKIKITELQQLNTDFREVNLNISPDGQYLYFMSTRGGQKWSQVRFLGQKVHYDGDLWYAQKKNDEWQAPHCLPWPVNTPQGEDEPVITPDGQNVYFQSWNSGWASSGGPYYKAELHGDQWSKTKYGLYGGINRFFVREKNIQEQYGGHSLATDGMSVSPDQRTFIVTYARDYTGPMDIYISRKDEAELWSDMRKLNISTEGNERSAFIAGDGQTLYFASDAYGGFGGLDILKTNIRPDGTCGEVINIGKPFNTKADDFGFVLTASGREAYFIRDDDIYYADISNADSLLKPKPVVIISGELIDSCGISWEADIFLKKENSHAVISEARSNSLSGRFSLVSPITTGKLILEIQLSNGNQIRQTITLGDSSVYQEISLNKQLPCQPDTFIQSPTPSPKIEPVEREMKLNVLFDYNKANLKPAYQQLIKDSLRNIPPQSVLNIQLTGHTDDHGSLEFNIDLGQRRANTVAAYLLQSGYPTRLITQKQSFGESKPVDSNQSDAGRQNNRRVEIQVKYQLVDK